MMPKSDAEKIYAFADFEIDPDRRLLLKNGEAVALKSKAFDLLLTLVQNRGAVLSKDELLETVWKDSFVEENNLTVHISALRKIFGETKNSHQFIVTVPGRGYRFVAELNEPTNGEIIIENRRISRIFIEEEEREKGRKGEKEKRRFLGFLPISASLLLLFLLLAVIGAAGFGAYQKYYGRQAFSAAWNDSALSVIEPRQMTADGKMDFASLAPDGNYFAFVVGEAENQSLWFGQTGGNQKLQIRPPEKVKYYGLTFAPDGKQIYYAAGGALYRIPTMGGAAQKVLDKIKTPVTFSPDSKQIAFVRSDDERKLSLLIAADAETGANEREIAARPAESGFTLHGAAWSPDGNLIAVGANTGNPDAGDEILLVNAADGKTQKFGEGNWNSVRRTAWLKDGSGLLVNVIEKDNWDDRHVWLFEFPGGQSRKITRDVYRYSAASVSVSDDNSKILALREQTVSNIFVGAVSDFTQSKQITQNSMGKRDGTRGLSWTADGKLVFSQFFDKSQTLWTMNADGENVRQITPPGFLDRHISISKDGRQIFFDSMRNGVWNIWRVAADGGEARQITTDGGVRPAVSPDGKWIFYTGNFPEGYHSIWKISTEGGEAVRVLDAADWTSIAPDGTRFACVFRTKGEKSRVGIFPLEGGGPLAQFDLDVSRDFGEIRWSGDAQSLIYRSTGLWRQTLSGGKAEKIIEFAGEIIFGFDISPDGNRFAVSRGNRDRDVVLIERK